LLKIATARYGKEEQKTKLSKKQIALIALAAILVVSNIAFAVLYMTKHVEITGGVETYGAIEVYDDDGVTPLTSIDFPNFTGGIEGWQSKWFFINNTGTSPVYVYWNISASSIAWTYYSNGYKHVEDTTNKYYLMIRNATSDYWTCESEARMLDVGQGIHEEIILMYNGDPVTAELFSVTVAFTAKDA